VVDPAHERRLILIVLAIVLDNAKAVDPEKAYSQPSSHKHGVLEHLREFIPKNIPLPGCKSATGCLERLYTAPAMAETYVAPTLVIERLVQTKLPSSATRGEDINHPLRQRKRSAIQTHSSPDDAFFFCH